MKRITKKIGLMLVVAMLLTNIAHLSAEGLAPTPGEFPLVEEGTKLTVGVEQAAMVEDFESNKMTEHLQDKTGFDLDFIIYPANEMLTKLELSVSAAGDDLPDVLLGSFAQNVIMPWAKAKMIIPLNEYFDSSFYWGEQSLKTESDGFGFENIRPYITSYDGNIYSMYSYNSTLNNQYSGARLNIYRPWLEKLNLKMPATTDELFDLLIAIRDGDPNGNGQQDEIPLTGYNEGTSLMNLRRYLMTPFVYTQDNYWIIQDGKIDVSFTQDGWREGLSFVRKLYDEKLIDPAIFTQDQAAMTVTLSQDPPVVGTFSRFSSTNMSADDQNRYLFDRSEHLTGPDGETRTSVSPAIPVLSGLITKNCSTPREAFMLLDYMNSQEVSTITRFGYVGEDFQETDKDEERSKLISFWEEQEVNMPKELYGDDFELPVNTYNYDPSTWGTLQNKWWSQIGPNTMTETMNRLFTAAGNISNEKEQWTYISEFRHYYHLTESHKHRNNDLIVAGLVYTEDEQEVITERYTEIRSFVEESWASFVTGATDINDDAAWENYLSTIEKMGLEDCINVTQTCYDRMYE